MPPPCTEYLPLPHKRASLSPDRFRHFLHPSFARNAKRVAFPLNAISFSRRKPSVAPQEGLSPSRSLLTPPHPSRTRNASSDALPPNTTSSLHRITLCCPSRGPSSLQIAFDTPTPLSCSKHETGSLQTTHHLLVLNTLCCPTPSLQLAFDTH